MTSLTTTTTVATVLLIMILELSVPHVSYVFGTKTKMLTSSELLFSQLDWC